MDEHRTTKGILTSIIDKLENRNMIIRFISKRDRQSHKLELGEKSKVVQDEHIKFEEEVKNSLMFLKNEKEVL